MNQCLPIAVVIPAHNAIRYLNDSLSSILHQTCFPQEVVIVDDHSEDGTFDYAQKFTEKFNEKGIQFYIYSNTRAASPAASRNLGITKAKVEWIAFLDADDKWLPAKLERFWNCIQDSQWKDCVLFCHDEYLWNGAEILGTNCYSARKRQGFEALLRGNFVSTSASCVRRSVLLELGGFNESLRYFGTEDWDLWLKLSKQGKFRLFPELLGMYRINEGISSNLVRQTRNAWNVFWDHLSILPLWHKIKLLCLSMPLIYGFVRSYVAGLIKNHMVKAK